MICMQYSFTLPADYDMSLIDRRVRDKGRALDDHAPLAFKAYLAARHGDPVTRSRENVYAPFYLWRDDEGLRDFVAGAGFAGLARSFGWPAVRTWPGLLSLQQAGNLASARFASRESVSIPPFGDLADLRQAEERLSYASLRDDHALLALSAFEPTTWTLVRFRLWRDAPPRADAANTQHYDVQHVSQPAARA